MYQLQKANVLLFNSILVISFRGMQKICAAYVAYPALYIQNQLSFKQFLLRQSSQSLFSLQFLLQHKPYFTVNNRMQSRRAYRANNQQVSPRKLSSLRLSSYNENLQYSNTANSRAYEDAMKQSVSTRQHTQNRSSENLYICKLESRVLELEKKIDHQKFQVQSLTEQAQIFMRTCDQQKRQLSSYNIDMLRQQYDQQIEMLADQRNKISQLIMSLTQEYRLVEMEEESKILAIKAENIELARRIEVALTAKQQKLKRIAQKDQQRKDSLERISLQEYQLDQLRNIERKLFIAIKQLERYQKQSSHLD